MIIFEANVNVAGTITFLGDAVNKGTINGNAIFKDNSVNSDTGNTDGDGGIVNGDLTVKDCALNGGRVSGEEIYERKSDCPPDPYNPYLDFNPPLICGWNFSGSTWRRISCLGINNPQILSTVYGKWQKCPPDVNSCREQPQIYRERSRIHYVLDPRVIVDVNGNFVEAQNYPDGYVIPEGYEKPDHGGEWYFDFDGSIKPTARAPEAVEATVISFWVIRVSWVVPNPSGKVNKFILQYSINNGEWATAYEVTYAPLAGQYDSQQSTLITPDVSGAWRFRIIGKNLFSESAPSPPSNYVDVNLEQTAPA